MKHGENVSLLVGASQQHIGVLHALSAEDSVASEVAEPTLEGAGEPTLHADQQNHTGLSMGEKQIGIMLPGTERGQPVIAAAVTPTGDIINAVAEVLGKQDRHYCPLHGPAGTY